MSISIYKSDEIPVVDVKSFHHLASIYYVGIEVICLIGGTMCAFKIWACYSSRYV